MLDTLARTTIPAEDEALRELVRAVVHEQLAGVTASRRARSWMGFDAELFTRVLATRGWALA